MVLHIPGDIIGTPAFERTLDDVALMSLLGVKIVLVCGIAHQVCLWGCMDVCVCLWGWIPVCGCVGVGVRWTPFLDPPARPPN